MLLFSLTLSLRLEKRCCCQVVFILSLRDALDYKQDLIFVETLYMFTLDPSMFSLYPYPYTLTLIFLPFNLRFLPFTLTLKPVLCCLAMYFPQCCESGCPRVPRKPIAITADANPQVPPGCPLNSANAGPATFWRGAPRAVPWGIINIKEVETSRGAPRHPSGCAAVHAGH